MNSKSLIIFVIVLLQFFPDLFGQQRGSKEIQLYNDDDTQHVFDASAENRLIWNTSDLSTIFFLTDLYSDVSSDTVNANSGGSGFGWNWVEDLNDAANGNAFAYSRYKIWLTDDTDEYFYLDYRDDDCGHPGYSENWDIEVHYWASISDWRLREAGIGDYVNVDNGETIGIWQLYLDETQNTDSLLIPVCFTTDQSVYKPFVKVGGVFYETAYFDTANAENVYTIEYVNSKVSGAGYIFSFSSWSSGGAQQHSASGGLDYGIADTVSLTNKTIPIPGSFAFGTPSGGHPTLTWTTVEGDSMAGYEIERKYGKSGSWTQAATINDDETDEWVDTFINETPDNEWIFYRMRTKDCNDDYSDYTGLIYTWGSISLKGESRLQEDSQMEAGPVEFSLCGNYPNPFNPQTIISWELPVSSSVTVMIYDVAGREIISLVDGVYNAGAHTAVWDACDQTGAAVTAGMYLYRLIAQPEKESGFSTFTATGKMVLLR